MQYIRNFLTPKTTTTILIGNPGVGKSTLLNCLLGNAAEFRSGISIGGGLTQVLQVHIAPDGNQYVDTPGLSDVNMRVQAAKEIEKGLRMGGTFKVFFVVVLEAGRVRAEDATTIKLILESAPQIESNYSIIFNKLTKPVHDTLLHSEQAQLTLVASLCPLELATYSVHFNIKQAELEDKENQIIPLDPKFLQFIKNAPKVEISPAKVECIKSQEFEERNYRMGVLITALLVDQILLNEKIRKMKQKISELKEKQSQGKEHQQEEPPGQEQQANRPKRKAGNDDLKEPDSKRGLKDKQ